MKRKTAFQLWTQDVREALAIGYSVGHVDTATLWRLYLGKAGMTRAVRIIAAQLAR